MWKDSVLPTARLCRVIPVCICQNESVLHISDIPHFLVNVITEFVFKYLHYKLFLHIKFIRLVTACCKVPRPSGEIM